MDSHPDICDVPDVEILKQILHEETEVKTIKAAQKDEEASTAELPLELSLKRRLDELPAADDNTAPLTMFRMPADIRERNKMFYEPQMVSIGPFYHGRENLRTMEEQKIYHLRDFLSRNHEIDIKMIVEEMKQLEEEARKCYAERIDLDSREFVEMLLLDSCFIIETVNKWLYNEPADRLRHVIWVTGRVIADLLLVENQIPFFVLLNLIRLIQAAELVYFLVKYLQAFGESKFVGIVPSQIEAQSIFETRNLVHLFYQLYVPKRMLYRSNPKHVAVSSNRKRLFNSLKSCICLQPNQPDVRQINEEPVCVFPCVSELLQSGIIFKPKKSAEDLFDITFQAGVIEMPPLSVDPIGKKTFLNIVAFEQSNGQSEFFPFSSYVALMENLVKTSKDVVALRQCGILYTFDPNEEATALFFNHAGQVFALDYSNHYFRNLFEEIKSYYDSRQSN